MLLDLDVRIRITIPDSLNSALEDGNPKAFAALETHLAQTLNRGLDTNDLMYVTKFQIEDAGPHNVSWSDEPPSKER